MREIAILAFLCLFLALASVGVLVWAALSGPILTLDGLLLASICLLLAAVFGFCFLWLANDARLWDLLRSRGQAAPQPNKKEPGQ
jgi:hypothetical protein